MSKQENTSSIKYGHSDREELLKEALTVGALQFGKFTLKSGRISPYFFNSGLLYSGKQLSLIAKCYADAIIASNVDYDIIFGPAYKGISLAAITAVKISEITGRNDIGFAYNRKEAKDHGEGGNLVGAPLKDKKILIIDDVMTAGTAIKEAISLIKNAGGKFVGVSLLLDRKECVSDTVRESTLSMISKEYGVPVFAFITFDDVLYFFKNSSCPRDKIEAMEQYRILYGA